MLGTLGVSYAFPLQTHGHISLVVISTNENTWKYGQNLIGTVVLDYAERHYLNIEQHRNDKFQHKIT